MVQRLMPRPLQGVPRSHQTPLPLHQCQKGQRCRQARLRSPLIDFNTTNKLQYTETLQSHSLPSRYISYLSLITMQQHQHGPQCQHGHGHVQGHGHGSMPGMMAPGQGQEQSPQEYFRDLKKRWSDPEMRVFFWQELLHGVIIDRTY
jgi:hypothetical protein